MRPSPRPNPEPVSARLRVGVESLRRRVREADLDFASTATVAPLEGPLGQARAAGAIAFGTGLRAEGYNIYASGPPGSGRSGTTRLLLERAVAGQPVPPDWVYLHDFESMDRPRAVALPAGLGVQLGRDMDAFVKNARHQIAHAFESDSYAEARRQLNATVATRREALLEHLAQSAKERGYSIEGTPVGLVSVALRDGQPLTREAVSHMSEAERADVERKGEELQEEIANTLHRVAQLEHEAADDLVKLDQQTAFRAVEPLLAELRRKYSDNADVLGHLEQMQKDLPPHLADFRRAIGDGQAQTPVSPLETAVNEDHLDRYRVNVLVDNSALTAPPIVIEANPTYYNLIGRMEYRATFGTMVTDFMHVKAGALHRANGGFLVLYVEELLRNPFSWDALLRALLSHQLKIENLGEQLSAYPSATLQPEPIPLDVKVVLIGSPLVYQLLWSLDEHFRDLFKVHADFSAEVDWDMAAENTYAGYISRLVADERLAHFSRGAVARLIEELGRVRGSQRKLSARLSEIRDLVVQAAYWGAQHGHELVQARDVGEAVDERDRRSALTRERLDELIQEGTLRIESEGERTGQVNGMAVLELGEQAFGLPVRVTASVGLGHGTLESIEREAHLSGPIHSKGVLTVSGYLAERYGQELPLPLRATVSFEQSYDEIEGDSASSTELYALLSAISGLPIAQGIAVTGSVDQHGNVQAVGGVTQKVEGFFRVCQARGLRPGQGVIVPAACVADLMLNEDVVAAARKGDFTVWAVSSIDEGIEILTGRPAGERDERGHYPDSSVHGLVTRRLGQYLARQREFATPPNGATVKIEAPRVPAHPARRTRPHLPPATRGAEKG